MLLYNNITFDYEGEHFRDSDGRKFEELSVPVEVDENGLCNYPVSFTLYELDKDYYPQTKSFQYGGQPFYTGKMKYFTKEPKFEVPKMFQDYLQNLDEKQPSIEDTEHDR